ncbi:MAG: substrate-binding domain-containing protein [Desulfosudis oleivorans]|nr:substrate-binding domain-containing protein [Desulfosudis oleivorans]
MIVSTASLILTACGSGTDRPPSADSLPQANLSGTISVSGAFALYPMMTVWAEEFTQDSIPDVQFDVQGGGAGKGMTDTIAGAVDIGMISRTIKPEEELPRASSGYPSQRTRSSRSSAQKIPCLPIKSSPKAFSQETFNKIFITGEIKTWGEVVGKPEITDEIHVFTRSDACWRGRTCGPSSPAARAQDDIQGIGVNGEPSMRGYRHQRPAGNWLRQPEQRLRPEQRRTRARRIVIPPIDINDNGQADADGSLHSQG